MIAEAAILRARSPIYRDMGDDAAVTLAAVIDLCARNLLEDTELSVDQLVETIESLIALGACRVVRRGEAGYVLEADEQVAAQLMRGTLQ